MSATHKSGGVTAQVDTFLAEYAKGIEKLVELGRQAFDGAAQKSEELVKVWTKGAGWIALPLSTPR